MSQQPGQNQYDQLVQQLQQTQDLPELIEQWRRAAQTILRKLNADMKKVKLRNPAAARKLVIAAFANSLDFREPVVVAMGAPVGEKAEMLASETIGVYPEDAFNVTAFYVADCVTVYLSTVPENGNQRR